MQNEIGKSRSKELLQKFLLSSKTIEKNVQRVDNAAQELTSSQDELSNAKFALFNATNSNELATASATANELERKIEGNLTQLRRAQECLRKSHEHKKKLTDKIVDDE